MPSFAAGLARVEFPATEQEHRLRTLLDHARDGGAVEQHELARIDPALARGVETVVARRSRAFTRFDGNLTGHAVPAITDDGVVVSATRLQAYAYNPHEYLLDYVLRVEIPELPEDRYEVTPMDRGSLVHETLDAFLAAVLARPGGAPAPDAAWTVADRELMHDLAETRMAVYEAHGRTGRRLFWHRDRRRILAELDRFLDADDTVRAEWGMRPIATELRFGFADGARPVDLQLSDGRALRFRGAADRIDVTGTGALWIVDYKTGNPNRYRLSDVDPTSAGTMLQLPVYAHAARASFGTPDTPVSAAYWLVSTRGKFELEELELDDAVDRRVDEVLRAIADGIGGGRVPVPGRSAQQLGPHLAQLHRPRRSRHPRPLPGVAPQAGGTRAPRLRRVGGARRARRRPSRGVVTAGIDAAGGRRRPADASTTSTRTAPRAPRSSARSTRRSSSRPARVRARPRRSSIASSR